MLPLLLISIISISFTYAQIEDNSEFIMENAKLCGNPFADPIWIPVLDACTEDCDSMTEYCVENEDLQQQCKELPDECKELLAQRAKHLKSGSNFAAGIANIDAQLDDDIFEDSLNIGPPTTLLSPHPIPQPKRVPKRQGTSNRRSRVKRL